MKKLYIILAVILICSGWYYVESSKYDGLLDSVLTHKKNYTKYSLMERIPYGDYNLAIVNDSTFILGHIADWQMILDKDGHDDKLSSLKHLNNKLYYSLFINNDVDTMQYFDSYYQRLDDLLR